jgi:hypothetical protein
MRLFLAGALGNVTNSDDVVGLNKDTNLDSSSC